MRRVAAILALALLVACGRTPTPLELSYDERLKEAQTDCKTKGGDEFKPYGSIAWYTLFVGGGKPMIFRCQRLQTHWKRGLAVYAFQIDGNRVSMEIR